MVFTMTEEKVMSPAYAPGDADIGIMDVSETTFYKNPMGFLALKYRDAEYKRVKLSRAVPFTQPYEYISVADMESKEIGIIRNVAALSRDMQTLVREELENRYFCPEVTYITSVKEKMGYLYFEVKIGEYKKIFAVKDITRNIKMLDEKRLVITDVDGNRFLISDLFQMSAKNRRKLEPYLY